MHALCTLLNFPPWFIVNPAVKIAGRPSRVKDAVHSKSHRACMQRSLSYTCVVESPGNRPTCNSALDMYRPILIVKSS
jgi:hypothetical protein